MSTNSGIVFTQPAIPFKHGIIPVEKVASVSRVLAERPIPAFPPLRLSQILKLIENGSADVVSVMEWLSVFHDKLEIDDSAECQRACELLWQAISNNERVCRIALFSAAHYIEGQQQKFPQQLIDTLDIAQPLLKGMHLKRVTWLIALRDKHFDTCIKLAHQIDVSPFEYHTHLSLPSTQQHRNEYVCRLLPFIDEGNIQGETTWLSRCLEQMTRVEKIAFSDQMLVEHQSITELMEEWIKAHCLPDSDDTIWFDLDVKSRSILKKRFKMSSYYSLQALIDNICELRTANLLALSERDIKQLRSRALFWSNYSEKFNQTRLLIPYKTSTLTRWDKTLEVIVLPDTAEENSEVCIFDIGDRILVEVLRGDASELRIFESTSRNKERLLHDNDLTLRGIRQMACSCIHDHVALWQHFCEQVLRTQHKIYPNSGLKTFHGLAKKGARYSEQTGLTAPSESIFQERIKQLEPWNNAFWAREARVKGQETFASENFAWRELQQAKLAKLQNNREDYLTKLKMVAYRGNAEAEYLYGVYQINSPNSDSNTKIQAEMMIARSAKSGYVPAVELASKFNLSFDHDNALDSYPQLGKNSKLPKVSYRRNRLTEKQSNEDKQSDDVVENSPKTSPKVKKSSTSTVPNIDKRGKNYSSVETNSTTLPKEIMKKIRVEHSRPYIALKIEELEEVSRVYANFTGIQKTLLNEINNRKITQRIERLRGRLETLTR